jgi:hypothetical protein
MWMLKSRFSVFVAENGTKKFQLKTFFHSINNHHLFNLNFLSISLVPSKSITSNDSASKQFMINTKPKIIILLAYFSQPKHFHTPTKTLCAFHKRPRIDWDTTTTFTCLNPFFLFMCFYIWNNIIYVFGFFIAPKIKKFTKL